MSDFTGNLNTDASIEFTEVKNLKEKHWDRHIICWELNYKLTPHHGTRYEVDGPPGVVRAVRMPLRDYVQWLENEVKTYRFTEGLKT